MTYNLRPRRASTLLREAARPVICRFEGGKARVTCVCTQDEKRKERRANDCDCVGPEEDSSWQGNHCATAPLALSNEDVPRSKQDRRSFPSAAALSPSEVAAEGVVAGCKYRTRRSFKRIRHNGGSQPMACGFTVPLSVNCAVQSPVITRVDSMSCTAKCSPSPARHHDTISSLRSQRKTPLRGSMRSASPCVPKTFGCQQLLQSSFGERRSKCESVCKAVGGCNSQFLHASLSLPVEGACQSATTRPQFRHPETAPRTPARSINSSRACSKYFSQAGCSSERREHLDATVRHTGEAEATQVFVLLSSSTVTTPSASRQLRKRKREYMKPETVFRKKQGLSPSSFSIRTRSTASTVPSPSDLAYPPFALPLASPITEPERGGAAVSLTAAGFSSKGQSYNPTPHCVAPPLPTTGATELPPSANRSKSFVDDTLDSVSPAASGDQCVVRSDLESIPAEPLAETKYGAARNAVDFLRLGAHSAEHASPSRRGAPFAAAPSAVPVRRSGRAHRVISLSPSSSAIAAMTADGHPIRVRCRERRRGTQPLACLQQGGGRQAETTWSFPCNLSQTQVGGSPRTLRAALPSGSRGASLAPRVAYEDSANESNALCNVYQAGRAATRLSSDGGIQQSHASCNDATVTRGCPSQSDTASHCSALRKACSCKRERSSEKKNPFQSVLATTIRLPQTSSPKQFCLPFTPADNGMRSGTAQPPAPPDFHDTAWHRAGLTRHRTPPCQRPSGSHESTALSCFPPEAGRSLLLGLLPPVILCKVLCFLPPASLAAFGATCTYTQRVLRLPATWRYLDERSVGRWMRQHDRLAIHSSPCVNFEHDAGNATQNEAKASPITRQQVSRVIETAAEPFACVSRISVDLTNARSLHHMRNVSQAIFSLPAAALLGLTPVQIGGTEGSRIATSSGGDCLQGTAPTAPATAPSPLTNTPPRLIDRRIASPPALSTALNQTLSPSDGMARPAAGTSSHLNSVAPVHPLQPINEEHPITRPPHSGTRGADTLNDATANWQSPPITSMQRVANELFETHADVQPRRQTDEVDPARTRGGQGSSLSMQHQRERLRRTLTLLLTSRMSTFALRTCRLPLVPHGLQPQTIHATREPIGVPARSAAEPNDRHVDGAQPDGEFPSLLGVFAVPPRGLTVECRGLRSHATLEGRSSPFRGMRQRSSVPPMGSRLPTLLQRLSAQAPAAGSYFHDWSRERQQFHRQAQDPGTPSVPSLQPQKFFHHRRPMSESSVRVSELSSVGRVSVVNFQLRPEHPAREPQRATQTASTSGHDQTCARERTEGSGRMRQPVFCQHPVSRRDRQRLLFFHHLILRLQRPQQVSQGPHLPEAVLLSPRPLCPQTSRTDQPSRSEADPSAEGEGRAQQSQRCVLAHEQLRPGHSSQNGADLQQQEFEISQVLQVRAACGNQGSRTCGRVGHLEGTNQSVQGERSSPVRFSPVHAVAARGTTNICTGHSQPFRVVPRDLLSTQTDQQCATGRQRLRSDQIQADSSRLACIVLQQSLDTLSQTRRGTQEALPFSERPSSSCDHVFGESANRARSTHGGGAAENVSTHSRRQFAVNEGNSKDTQRLRSLRGLLVHMQQLVQVSFQLEARDSSRLERLRAELLTLASLLRRNAATLRLIKISVDLFTLEGAAEVKSAKALAQLPVSHECTQLEHAFPEPAPATTENLNIPSSARRGSASAPRIKRHFQQTTCRDNMETERGVCAVGTPADQILYKVDSNPHVVHLSNGGVTGYKMYGSTQATTHSGKWTDIRASQDYAHERPAQGLSPKGLFSCFSPRTLLREATQGDCVDGRERSCMLLSPLPRPLRCNRVSLPNSFLPISKDKLATDKAGEEHGGMQGDFEEEENQEEIQASRSGLRPRHVQNLAELGLSPCHTLSPYSDVALSLQSSPTGETSEDLVRQLREAFTNGTVKDTPEHGADCVDKEVNNKALKSCLLDRSNSEALATCHNVSCSPSTIYTETVGDTYCRNSEKVLAVSDEAAVEDWSRDSREKGQHVTPRNAPLANLQRLLHIGRETLQQVDLQGDPPRTFCCLHPGLKFSKLKRLSLGWTCTAELVVLHNMLLKGNLPQLRKLQFSGPSGGAGLSMMHLQLYALLNSPPSACPHHPSFPLPETICLTSSTLLDVPLLSPSPSPAVVPRASADLTCCERFYEGNGQTKPVTESEESGEQEEVFSSATRGAKAAAVAISLRGDELRLEETQFVSHFSGQGQRQHKRAKAHACISEAIADHILASNGEDVAHKNVLQKSATREISASPDGENDYQACGSGRAAVGGGKIRCTHASHQTDSNGSWASAIPEAPQLFSKCKEKAGSDTPPVQLLACPLALAEKAFTPSCERCATLRGGTAHGVYFKYAALNIDFAALIDFRLALQRHGLFAFYKDDRNKLNLLHVEGLTEVSGREAHEEEKSLENRLERKNEWKRRFAYLHIQSPPFSCSSSIQSGSPHEVSHSKTDALSKGFSNVALWSVAPLPALRAPFGGDQRTVAGGTVIPHSRSPHSECARPALSSKNAPVASKTSRGNITRSVIPVSTERSAASLYRSSEAAGYICSSSNARVESVTSAYLGIHSGGLGTVIPAGNAEEETSAASPTNREVRISSDTSLTLAEILPASSLPESQNSQKTKVECAAIPVTPEKTGAGSLAGPRVKVHRGDPFPRDTTSQNRERRRRELQSIQKPRVSGNPSPDREHQGNARPSVCTGADGKSRACTTQEAVQGGTALQVRNSQKEKYYSRSGSRRPSGGVLRSSRAAARHKGNLSEVLVLRNGCEDGNHCRRKDEIDLPLNRVDEIIALFGPDSRRAGPRELQGSRSCRRMSTTHGTIEPQRSNEAAVQPSEGAAGPLASQAYSTDGNFVNGMRSSEEAEHEPPLCQGWHITLPHTQPDDQRRPSPQSSVSLPNPAPLSCQTNADNDWQTTVRMGAGFLPEPECRRTLCFPKVCPCMSGRDLFFLEMWHAPELCRDLQSAPSLLQLSRQLTYLWEHKLTAQQRTVYNDVIVKRYVQERQAVQEWNFDLAKAWWMGG